MKKQRTLAEIHTLQAILSMRSFLTSTTLSGFVLLLFTTVSCENRAERSASNQSSYPILRDSNTAIVISSLDDSYKPGDRLPFVFTPADLRKIDSLLLQSVDSYNMEHEKGDSVLSIDLIRTNYKRQLIPSIGNNGKRLVCVNCFCSEMLKWRTSIVMVDDGGECYFKIWINLDTGKVEIFSVNSLA